MAVTYKGGATPAQNSGLKADVSSEDPLRPINIIPDALSSVPEHLESPFKRLRATANELNKTSDDLNGFVARLDAVFKKLNLGVPAWVTISYSENEDLEFANEEIGYTRVGQRWGIALRSTEGCKTDHPDNWDEDFWLFNDAPRELRIRAVEKLPDLIGALDKAAQKMIKDLTLKVSEVGSLTLALESEVGGAK